MPDFGSGVAVILDAYFDIRFSPKFRVRTGKDKTPVGYELLQGDAFLLFPERTLASSLVPNRDVGSTGAGRSLPTPVLRRRNLQRRAGRRQLGRRDVDNNSGKDLAGRVVWQPFRSARTPAGALNGFGVQLGGSAGSQAGALLPAFRTSVGQIVLCVRGLGQRKRRPARVSRPRSSTTTSRSARSPSTCASTQAITRSGAEADVTNQGWEVTGSWSSPASRRRTAACGRRTASTRRTAIGARCSSSRATRR